MAASRHNLPSFESVVLSVQEKRGKIDGHQSGNFGFPIGTISANFDLQVAPIFTSKFRLSWHFYSGDEGQHRFQDDRLGKKKRKTDIQDSGHLGFPTGKKLAIFDRQMPRYFLKVSSQ